MINLTLLQEQADELKNFGNSKEIAKGEGMQVVINEVHSNNIKIASNIAHKKLIERVMAEKEISRKDAEEHVIEVFEGEIESHYTEECQDIFNEFYDIEMEKLEK